MLRCSLSSSRRVVYQSGVGSTLALSAELKSLATENAISVKIEARKSCDLADFMGKEKPAARMCSVV